MPWRRTWVRVRVDAHSLEDEDVRRQTEADVVRLERRLEEISTIDFFAAGGRQAAHGRVPGIRALLTEPKRRE